MPKAPRLCPGDEGHCTNLITHGSRCADCAPTAWFGAPRSQSSKITSTRAWRKLRADVLQRDNYQCQIRHPYVCTGHADRVDHIHNTAAGGAPLDPDNCQAACEPCNRDKAKTEAAAARRQRRPDPRTRHPGHLW